MKQRLAVIGALAVISAAGFTGVQMASATTDAGANGPMSGVVDAISGKFNLNRSEVQGVFDEQRSQMQAEREAKLKEQVAQLVTDGKLSQAQADKINAKRAELQKEREANRASNQSLTDEQRTAKREEHRAELDAWFKDNGIDAQYRYLLMGGRGQGGPGAHEGRMMNRNGSGYGNMNNAQ